MQIIRRCTLFVVLLALGWVGAVQAQDAGSDAPVYQVGSAIDDTSTAIVIGSEFGTDSVSVQRYQQILDAQMRRMPPSQQNSSTDLHREIVRGVTAQSVMAGAAAEKGYEVDTAQVSARLQQMRGQFQQPGQFQKALRESGMTVDSLRTMIADRIRQQKLQQEMADSAPEPSDEEVQTYAQENSSISASHILVQVEEGAPEARVDSARQAAEALIDSAQAGTDFAALARRHSDGPSSRKGGDLGSFTRDRMVKPFADAAFSIEEAGTVYPEPVRTRFGFHVIKLTGKGKPMATEKARKQLADQRKGETFETQLNDMLSGATVRLNPDVVQAGLMEGSQ